MPLLCPLYLFYGLLNGLARLVVSLRSLKITFVNLFFNFLPFYPTNWNTNIKPSESCSRHKCHGNAARTRPFGVLLPASQVHLHFAPASSVSSNFSKWKNVLLTLSSRYVQPSPLLYSCIKAPGRLGPVYLWTWRRSKNANWRVWILRVCLECLGGRQAGKTVLR